MNITHICLTGPVTDGWSYQDNLLTKYHARMGHRVTLIASRYIWSEKGTMIPTDQTDYINDDGVHMIRLENACGTTVASKIRLYRGLDEALGNSSPDILFIHGAQFPGIARVVRYLKKHPGVQVYVDNHADFSNSATNFLSRHLLHRVFYRHLVHKILPYTTKFYGVLPARVEFLISEYRVPRSKCELLVMGADDDAVAQAKSPEMRHSIREKYGIDERDFLVVTGGKIDAAKRQSLLLMDAVNQSENPRLKLIVFGSVAPELQDEVRSRCSDRVQYIGWVKGDDSYPLFAAADLACFPGRHSVYWEQVAGVGIPMLVKYWDGTTHIDLGGNARFLYHDSTEEIAGALREIMQPDTYAAMKTVAGKRGAVTFSYRDIARRAIEE